MIERAYADIKIDVPAAAGEAVAAVAAKVATDEAQPGPGLHNVVPA